MHIPTVVLDRVFDLVSEKSIFKLEALNVKIIKKQYDPVTETKNIDIVCCHKKTLQEWNQHEKTIDKFIVLDDNSLNLSTVAQDKIFYIPCSDFAEVSFLQIIQSLLYQKKHLFSQIIIQRLEKDSRTFLKKIKQLFVNITFEKNELKKLPDLLGYERAIFSSLDASNAALAFEESIVKCVGSAAVKIVDLIQIDVNDEKILYFSSTNKGLSTHYSIENYLALSHFELFCIGRLISAHLEFLDKIESDKLDSKYEDAKVYEKFLNQLDLPYAMFSHEELVSYNPAFIQLKIIGRDCLKLKNHEQILLNENIYEIIIKHLEINQQSHKLYFFKTDRKKNQVHFNPSNEELGIVSSSIAHELNNPLAGILAAVETMLLEDNLNDETKLELKEIKDGATRCKQLVETFLGFSRVNPLKTHAKSYKSTEQNELISIFQDSIDRALSLLRFRLIESNTKIETNLVVRENFNGVINPSIFAMILYLLLGNLITQYSHYLLIAVDLKDQPLKLDFIENKNQFSIIIKSMIKFDKKNISSKLTEHLLDVENFYLSFQDQMIVLHDRSQLTL
jgi:signal transduction histidine kinase